MLERVLLENQLMKKESIYFYLEVKVFEIRNGAGFIVAVCGNILLMPGLPKKPAAEGMTIDANQKISGLF